ncbi:50S ribosomal protein L4 [Candidatus Saccharibacteria bacterium]|nr:MAG: 50S ribosomal protein L4 [Candidatus Saccharibacteria bacterium]
MSVATYTKSGTKAAAPSRLKKEVFELEVKTHDLIKQAYLADQANTRANLAVTKKRGEVRGGGKKPWKQKGTGRARFGSSRVPIWRGGGIVFGPTGNENYSIKLNKAAKKTAIKQALSLSASSSKLIIIESIELKEAKTSAANNLLSRIGATGSVLVVVSAKTPELVRAFRNLANVKLAAASYLNVFDIINADHIVLTADAVSTVHDWLAASEKPAAKGGKNNE